MALVAQAMATPLRTTQAERSGMILLRALEDGGRFGIGGIALSPPSGSAYYTGAFFIGVVNR
jgi:hypothetical protein